MKLCLLVDTSKACSSPRVPLHGRHQVFYFCMLIASWGRALLMASGYMSCQRYESFVVGFPICLEVGEADLEKLPTNVGLRIVRVRRRK